MTDGTVSFARFPVTVNLDDATDTSRQLGLSGLFPTTEFDNVGVKILPMTGSNGVSKMVVVVCARNTV